jgi:hypothetical protein
MIRRACGERAGRSAPSIGVMGAPADQWYYPGREHLLFARETGMHRGHLTAFALPSIPPKVREDLTGDRHVPLQPVLLLPKTVVDKAR